jgi:hypothetical protein
MTTNINDAITKIETFLLTNPDEATVKALIKRLQDHEQAHQGQRVIADLAWKDQLPKSFPAYPRHEVIREFFRRIYNQLNKQGIAVSYAADSSSQNFVQWELEKEGKTGWLFWFRTGNRWEIQGFSFDDLQGEFAEVYRR